MAASGALPANLAVPASAASPPNAAASPPETKVATHAAAPVNLAGTASAASPNVTVAGNAASPTDVAAHDLGKLAALIDGGCFTELEHRAGEMLQHLPNSGLVWKALAIALQMQGGNSWAAWTRAAELLPNDAQTHGKLGDAALLLGQCDAAAAAYRRSLELDPRTAEVHNNLGNALLGLGQRGDAVSSYRRALALDADFAVAHNNLGNALRSLGQLPDAVASYREALRIKPDYAEANNNLGNAWLDAGQFAAAVTSYRQALEIRPGFTEAHNNLGNALRSLGEFDAASASYGRALELNGRFAAAHSNLSDVLRDLGRPADAAASSRRALEIDPELQVAHNSLGNALVDLGALDDAVASYGRACNLDPDFTEACVNLGIVLRLQGKAAEAEAICRGILERWPNTAAALIVLAELQADAGHFFAAETFYERAAVLDADLPEACAGIAHLRKMVVGDATWLARAQRIAAGPLPPRREVHLRYALGKYFDDVSDFDRAFAEYRRANEVTKTYSAKFDRQLLTRSVDRTVDAYDRHWAERARSNGDRGANRNRNRNSNSPSTSNRTDNGNRKSNDDSNGNGNGNGNGNRKSNDNRDSDSDSNNCNVSVNRSGNDNSNSNTNSDGRGDSARAVFIVGMPRSGTTLAEQILASHPAVFGAGELPFWSGAASGGNAAALGAVYLRLLKRLSPDALRVVDKMPANVWSLGAIHEALPEARFIHMQRNPLDTCLSIYFQHFRTGHLYANDLDDLAHYYREYLRVVAHWRATLPAGTMLDLPYEGLIEGQEAWTRTLLEFIGMPWDPRCLDFHESHRSVMTASKWQVRQRISASSVARWRNYEKHLSPLSILPRD